MRRSRRPCTVEVTGGFFLLLAWLNYTDVQSLLPMTLLAAALHEAGHLFAIYALGGEVSKLRLSAVGAELRMTGLTGYGAELICSLAGPMVNLLLAFASARIASQRLLVFAGINLTLGVFNLLPISALDGGRSILAAAALLTDFETSSALRRKMDLAVTLVLAVLGLAAFCRTRNLTALIVTGWLACAAGRERWEKGLAKQWGNG